MKIIILLSTLLSLTITPSLANLDRTKGITQAEREEILDEIEDKKDQAINNIKEIQKCEAILDKMQEEGRTYITIREARNLAATFTVMAVIVMGVTSLASKFIKIPSKLFNRVFNSVLAGVLTTAASEGIAELSDDELDEIQEILDASKVILQHKLNEAEELRKVLIRNPAS